MRFLLTGASGAGKSSARWAVAADLAARVECVELKDLERCPRTEMDWSRLTRLSWGVAVIDGSALTVAEVGDRVRQWIGAVRAGSAPVFRRGAR